MSNGADTASMAATLKTCYTVILGNAVWLLIPLFGLLTGNRLGLMLILLMIASVALILSNNYLAKKWYYSLDMAKGTPYHSHLHNIDNIGFVTFFVTMISGLAFLILAVVITNLIKANAGYYAFLVLDFAMSALLVALAVWVVKRASGGMKLAASGQEFKEDANAKLFGVMSAGG